MKQLVCEMCGGKDLIKQEGVFVCQSCGTKYSVEEAKKMMVEIAGTVEVKGKVAIDQSDILNNYIIRGNQLFEKKEYAEAEVYYNKALDIDANNPDARQGLRNVERIITEPNLTVVRNPVRTGGELKTVIYIDGVKCSYYNLDSVCKITLPVGNHIIYFKRATMQSVVININIDDRNYKYTIALKPKIFAIKTFVTKY